MFRAIAVPLDGSAFSEGALPLAVSLARLAHAPLHLVHVREAFALRSTESWLTDVSRRSGAYFEELVERLLDAGAPEVAKHVLEGPVLERLETFLEASGADLVVLSTHGRGGVTRAWLGSVADRLVRSSPVPLLLVRPGAEPRPLQEAQAIRHVLVPVDGSPASDAVLPPVLALARLTRADVTLLRVVEDPVPRGMLFLPEGLHDLDTLREEDAREAEGELAHLARRAESLGRSVTTRVAVGERPAEAILGHARAVPSCLVALSTRGRGGVGRAALGSVTDKVLRGAEGPVLVFPPPTSGSPGEAGPRLES